MAVKYTFMIIAFLAHAASVVSQCDNYIVKGSQVFHANDIRTMINTGGDMFWDLSEGKFQVPFSGSQTPTAVFATAVWIGGYDDVGNLKLAAQTNRGDDLESQEYLPGPLTQLVVPFDPICTHWDTIWSVTRYEIQAHILDYEDDGIISRPLKSIFGWPGIGNTNFENINGFPIPDLPPGFYPNGYAPFLDKDSDGIYEPERGEYPLPVGMSQTVIPDQITWHVFNCSGFHNASKGDPFGAEVQQTCYAFYCTDNVALNRTLFVDFKIVNRSYTILDSLFFGIWMDPDLGCDSDDLFGSVPEQAAFFVYNEDSIDGSWENNCIDQIPFSEGPPVLSGYYLNKAMSSFMYYEPGFSVPSAMNFPKTPFQFYRYLTGSWVDGTPLSYGGNGYYTGPGQVRTYHAFPGNPNDSLSWSMNNKDISGAGKRIVASTALNLLDPGESETISIGFTLHLDTLRNHLGNVKLMFEELPFIKQQWAEGMPQCAQLRTTCLDDCVWPGDANNDGITNHLDLLYLGLANVSAGPERIGPLSWAPLNADPWQGTFLNSVNFKHADANGDGKVDYWTDLDILQTHYGLRHDDYKPIFECVQGNELIVYGGYTPLTVNSFYAQILIRWDSDLIDSLHGIAFTVKYDAKYFNSAFVSTLYSPFNMNQSHAFYMESPGIIEYAATRLDKNNEAVKYNRTLLNGFLQINSQNIIGIERDTTELCLTGIHGILKDGTEILMGANTIQFVFLDENATSVLDVESDAIAVYPNPSSGQVFFEVPEEMIGAQYEIYNAYGAFELNGTTAGTTTEITLPAGVSFLIVNTVRGRFVKKIVVLE